MSLVNLNHGTEWLPDCWMIAPPYKVNSADRLLPHTDSSSDKCLYWVKHSDTVSQAQYSDSWADGMVLM